MGVVITETPHDGVTVVKLNRPRARNALNTELRTSLADVFEQLGDDNSTRCIVLTGGQDVFAAGADLKEIVDDDPIRIHERRVLQRWKTIAACPKPIVAAVNGVAFGGGCELALHADIIIAGENARFAQPELRVGLMPGGGASQRLMRALGKYQAMKMLLTCEPITGTQAAAMGMASEVVPDAQVLERALAVAQTIANLPPLAVRLTKEVALAGADASLDTGLILERRSFELLFATEDQKEGMRAFIEKRAPEFHGR